MTNFEAESNRGFALAITGLIVGIIFLLGGPVIFFICAGWASFEGGLPNALLLASLWTLFALLSFGLTITGRKKMIQAGRSGVLGTIGIIISILSVFVGIGIIVASFTANSSL
jgi:hypothetical protein